MDSSDEEEGKDGDEWGSVEPMEGLEEGGTAAEGGGDKYSELEQSTDNPSNLRYTHFARTEQGLCDSLDGDFSSVSLPAPSCMSISWTTLLHCRNVCSPVSSSTGGTSPVLSDLM